MPKSFQQKLKILYLMRVFSEKTDEAHPMSVKDLISYLESLGIHAERKTIYDDISYCWEIAAVDPETGALYQYLSGQRPATAGNRTGSGEEYKREHLL